VLVAAACSGARYGGPEGSGPGLTLPAEFAEGENDPELDAGSGDATAGDAESAIVRHGSLPDPEPLRLAEQWEYELVHEKGGVRVAATTRKRFAQPVVTARQMGRFAIELWIGSELIDRVRFDFPLLAAEEAPRGKRRPLHEPPSFASGAAVSRRVLVPGSPRATRAVLVDRATGGVTALPWPPDAPLPPPTLEGLDASTPTPDAARATSGS
jgi:hypothetical protein